MRLFRPGARLHLSCQVWLLCSLIASTGWRVSATPLEIEELSQGLHTLGDGIGTATSHIADTGKGQLDATKGDILPYSDDVHTGATAGPPPASPPRTPFGTPPTSPFRSPFSQGRSTVLQKGWGVRLLLRPFQTWREYAGASPRRSPLWRVRTNPKFDAWTGKYEGIEELLASPEFVAFRQSMKDIFEAAKYITDDTKKESDPTKMQQQLDTLRDRVGLVSQQVLWPADGHLKVSAASPELLQLAADVSAATHAGLSLRYHARGFGWRSRRKAVERLRATLASNEAKLVESHARVKAQCELLAKLLDPLGLVSLREGEQTVIRIIRKDLVYESERLYAEGKKMEVYDLRAQQWMKGYPARAREFVRKKLDGFLGRNRPVPDDVRLGDPEATGASASEPAPQVASGQQELNGDETVPSFAESQLAHGETARTGGPDFVPTTGKLPGGDSSGQAGYTQQTSIGKRPDLYTSEIQPAPSFRTSEIQLAPLRTIKVQPASSFSFPTVPGQDGLVKRRFGREPFKSSDPASSSRWNENGHGPDGQPL